MSEFSQNKFPTVPPPLGELIDFEKLDQANAMRDSQLDHLPLNNYPELISSADLIVQNLNNIRTQVGAPEMQYSPSVIRLMNRDQWKSVSRKSDPNNSMAHYDPLSGNIYQLFDEESYSSLKVGQIFASYTVAHELSHKATHGLSLYSFHLCEGLADYLAQQAIEKGALNPIIDKRDLDDYRKMYLEDGPVIIDGQEFKAKDIFVVPNEIGSGLTRVPQLRLIEAIQTKMPPEQFNALLRGAFTDDAGLIKNILREQFGEELACLFDDISGYTNPQDLESRILQTPVV